MPRTAHAAVGGYCYHALNRGNERGEVFHDAGDYHDFVRLIRQACSRVPMVIAYCLMPIIFTWSCGRPAMRTSVRGCNPSPRPPHKAV